MKCLLTALPTTTADSWSPRFLSSFGVNETGHRFGDEAQVRDRAVLAAHPMASKRPQV